jgi:hypothetical protein
MMPTFLKEQLHMNTNFHLSSWTYTFGEWCMFYLALASPVEMSTSHHCFKQCIQWYWKCGDNSDKDDSHNYISKMVPHLSTRKQSFSRVVVYPRLYIALIKFFSLFSLWNSSYNNRRDKQRCFSYLNAEIQNFYEKMAAYNRHGGMRHSWYIHTDTKCTKSYCRKLLL